MIVPIKDLLKIENIESYHLKFNRKDPSVSAAFVVVSQSRDINKSYVVTPEHLNRLLERGINNVSVYTDKKVMNIIRSIDPAIFLHITGTKKLGEFTSIVQEYEVMNQRSKKKRRFTVLEDVYSTEINLVRGERQLLMEYGTVLSSKILSIVRKELNLDQEVEYKDSENGVLVFVPEAKDFKLKVDLFAVLASLDLEIYDAKNVAEALDIYRTKFPKLVVLGNLNGCLDSKIVLMEIEEYDPFVKKLNYDESPASNREFETERVKSSYFSGYSRFLELENREKEVLPEEIKQNIMEAINNLQKNYSFENYIETSFAVKQFGRMFNVTALLHMLKNLRNRYS
ncbi:MAG: hypothetical protein KKH98_03695 [Spirochaetes bacterium]|nr:hypothetical protein [Spirochaetota bacterium]